MKTFQIILGIAALSVATISHAGSSIGKVTSMYVHSPNSGYSTSSEGVLIFSTDSPQVGAASCSQGEWAISLDTELGLAMQATLQTAMESNKFVIVSGMEACTDWSDRETPRYIQLTDDISNIASPSYTTQRGILTSYINKLLALLVPILNSQLPTLITQKGADPVKEVVDGNKSLGRFDLGICTAGVGARYYVGDVRGLSSVVVDSITIDNISWGTLSISPTIKMRLRDSLHAKAYGSIGAYCGVVNLGPDFTANIDATGVTANASATLKLFPKVDLSVDSLNLNYSYITPHPAFNPNPFSLVIGPIIESSLVSLLADVFKSQVTDILQSKLIEILNDEIHKIIKPSVAIPAAIPTAIQ